MSAEFAPQSPVYVEVPNAPLEALRDFPQLDILSIWTLVRSDMNFERPYNLQWIFQHMLHQRTITIADSRLLSELNLLETSNVSEVREQLGSVEHDLTEASG